MENDVAVFSVNEDSGELEQLTFWMSEEAGMLYVDSTTYFPEKKKVLLKQVSKYWK